MPRGKKKTPKIPGFMRTILAENIKSLIARDLKSESNQPKALAKKAGLSLSTIQRILAGETGASLDNIEAIAEAFEISAYQILIPGLDAPNPQVVKGATEAEKRMYRRWQQARILGSDQREVTTPTEE